MTLPVGELPEENNIKMIVAEIEKIPVIDGLILIDCVKVAHDSHQETRLYYQQLLKLLSTFSFTCVVNSAASIEIDYSDRSQLNTFDRYCWSSSIGQPKSNTRHEEIIYNTIRFSRPGNYTSQLIHNRLLDNDRSIFLVTLEDFLYHNQTTLNDKIRNWLVVGQTWGMCAHDNNIGLKNIAKLSQSYDLNFYAIDQGFNMHTDYLPAVYSPGKGFVPELIPTAGRQEFENDSLRWAHIPNFGYQLLLD